jgi:pimeloyl-ACP methyl ester carboxylesterase
MYYPRRKVNRNNIAIIIFSFVIIVTSSGIITASINYFGINTIHFAYGQASQMNLKNDSNNTKTNSLDVQEIPAKRIHVGDIDIAYKVFGKGEPLLLISGSGLVMDAWDPTILRDLSSTHTVIIFDNRGVGNTTTGDKPFSIVQFANDTAGLLDALKIQKADVLGFSMASFIAQKLVLLHPEKVNRLVLYGASCGGKENIPQSPEVVKILSDFANDNSSNSISQQDPEKLLSVQFPLAWIKSHHNDISLPQSKEIVRDDTIKKQFNIVEEWFATNWSGVCNQLSKITIPTLVITGTEDIAVPAANSLIIAGKIPGSWLVQIKDAGHGLMYQYPDKLSKVCKHFFQ